MMTTFCPGNDQLKAFCLGHLPDEQSDELLAHIGACTSCQAELETVANVEDSLIVNLRERDPFAELEDEPALHASIMRALDAISAEESPSISGNLPTTIGEYEIVRRLGNGGMGQVYLAHHTKLGRHVALKVLAGHRLSDHRVAQRFASEMRAIGHLSHPNIVTAFDAREIDGTAVLVTEFIDGIDLGHLVHRVGALSIADACEIVRQVAIALQYTSERGFVHRDVKPSNIMLSRTGDVKLLDLGLARFLFGDELSTEVTGTGQTLGTADYVSPEQITDSRSVDARADIYSLGCTLLKLITGRAPFADSKHSNAFAKMTAHVSTVAPKLKDLRRDVPNDLSQLVESMLAKSPGDRPQNPMAVAQLLEKHCTDADLEGLLTSADARREGELHVQPACFDERHSDQCDAKPFRQALPAVELRRTNRKHVSIGIAVALAFLSALVGFALGVVVTIRYSDGRTVVHHLPEDASVTIESSDDGTQQKSPISAETPAAEKVFSPLAMAVLISPDKDAHSTGVAVAALKASSRYQPVLTDIGTWYPVSENVDAKYMVAHNGANWALASRDPNCGLIWSELLGQLSATTTLDGTHMRFGKEAAKKLTLISSENQGQHLALILAERIVIAPVIRNTISESAVFTIGELSKDEMSFLHRSLNGDPFVNPPASPSREKPVRISAHDELRDDLHDFINGLQAVSEAIAAARSPANVQVDIDHLADRIIGKHAKTNSNLKLALNSVRSFSGFVAASNGTPRNATWLTTMQHNAFTFVIDYEKMISECRSFVDLLASQKGVFDSVIKGLKTDPTGPRVDLNLDILPNIGRELIVVPSSDSTHHYIIAFAVTNKEKLRPIAERLASKEPLLQFQILGDYLVIGDAHSVQSATKRFSNSR